MKYFVTQIEKEVLVYVNANSGGILNSNFCALSERQKCIFLLYDFFYIRLILIRRRFSIVGCLELKHLFVYKYR